MRIANRIRELFSSRVRQDYSEIVIYYGKIEIDSRPVALAILFDQDNFRRIKLFMWDNSIGLDEFKQIFNSAFTMLLISTFQNDTIFRFYLKKLTDIKVTILPSGNKITQCMAASPPNNIYIDLGWILPYILKIKRKEITANEFVKIVNDLVSGTGHEVAHISDPFLAHTRNLYQSDYKDLVARILRFYSLVKVEAAPKLREYENKPIPVDVGFVRKFIDDTNACISLILTKRMHTLSLANLFILSKEKAFLIDLEEQYRTSKSKVHPIAMHFATIIALEILIFMNWDTGVWLYDKDNEQTSIKNFGEFLEQKAAFSVSIIKTDWLRSIVVGFHAMPTHTFIGKYESACDILGIKPDLRVISTRQFNELESIFRSQNPR